MSDKGSFSEKFLKEYRKTKIKTEDITAKRHTLFCSKCNKEMRFSAKFLREGIFERYEYACYDCDVTTITTRQYPFIEIKKKAIVKMDKNLMWCVIKSDSVNEELVTCSDKNTAVNQAMLDWDRLSIHDKKINTITAALCNIQDGHYYEDEHGNIDADIYDIAWDSKK